MSDIKHTPTPWSLETVQTSCGIVHKIGPFPWKDGKQNHACIYVDYASDGPIERELLANARLMAASPAMSLALDMLSLGMARIDRSGRLVEFCFQGIRYSCNGDWNALIDVIGWDFCRAAVSNARSQS